MSHTCHAFECKVPVKREMFMCPRHWRMLPQLMQRGIWAAYRPGQCDDLSISKLYAERAKACIRFVAEREKKTIPEGHIDLAMYDHLADE